MAHPGSGTNTIPSITKSGAHTANCYIVSAPGHYCFPIVYGNAIDKTHGNATTGYYNYAYQSRTTQGLGNYVNADGRPIQSPFILEDSNLTIPSNLEAIVLWQDTTVGFRILDDGVPYDGDPEPIRIVDAPSGAGLTGKYIQFYIDPADILPGNIVIALRNKGNSDKVTYDLLHCPLGWTPPLSLSARRTTARSATVRIVPEAEGGEVRLEFRH